MATSKQHRTWIFDISRQLATAALAFAIVLVLAVLFTPFVQAQTFNVIHNFSGGGDGAHPRAGLTKDAAGNFYGTTRDGGTHGQGTVFKLVHKGTGWVLTPLYSFAGGDDGANPDSKVVFGPDGNLYGTTTGGAVGCNGNCTVFKLTPPATVCKSFICPGTKTVIHRFMGGSDGDEPGYGDLIFDQAGNIYGSTEVGGSGGAGTVYELMLVNGSWMESVLYGFSVTDGSSPNGMALDNAGNLYGTTYYGGTYGVGVVFELTPSESGWTETILHEFGVPGEEGDNASSGLIFDPSGNLYGTTPVNVFSMTPLNGNWTYTSLYAFSSGTGSYASLIMDAAGNLYGTTFTTGAYGYGSVFKLTRSGDSWTYTDLHDFTGGSDGGHIYSGLYLDANGNLYGTASVGGASGNGVVFEITQPF
jgi:uncharacterized repeat protein (TIGR03803 family)